jgi:hypothetical protein
MRDQSLCGGSYDGRCRRGSLDGRSGGSVGGRVLERGHGSGLVNLGRVLINFGRRVHFSLGLGEYCVKSTRETTANFEPERILLVFFGVL